MTEKEKDASMNLPPGVTCDSCFAFYYCNGIGCSWSGRTQCDYFPNRYRPAANSRSQPQPEENSR